ncbi:hypothetical protein CS022_05380 [Veronia nyctiphanis]|uniref:Uncharacterized protein n=1 Tax=Veronia nyctiphanis TaxID=1278244 RepID=A0A4Q0YTM4_9GAMM|nr:hypothetical protein [Veronia nyctiphanis]RXJ74073.1 hypothetical protein CS022_05380 [Veronia nyctiphanis]
MIEQDKWLAASKAGDWNRVCEVIASDVKDKPVKERASTFLKAAQYAREHKAWHAAIHCYRLLADIETDDEKIALVYSWMSSCFGESREFKEAESYGRQSLALRDRERVSRRKNTRRVVSFSLYGQSPKYCETAIINADVMPDIYPGWEMWVYHDDSVPDHVLERLKQRGVVLISASVVEASHMPGTFWRFLALESLDVDMVICRDADSIVCAREKCLVDSWLKSDKSFHVIRDWFGHTDLILAGLWGARHGLLTGVRAMIDRYLVEVGDKLHSTHADQFFLAEYVWPRIKHSCMHHSSVITEVLNAKWPDNEPRMLGDLDGNDQLGSWKTSSLAIPDIGDAMIEIIFDNKVLCRYRLDRGAELVLPRLYRERLQEGVYSLNIAPVSQKEV